jgi:hypothetical protein
MIIIYLSFRIVEYFFLIVCSFSLFFNLSYGECHGRDLHHQMLYTSPCAGVVPTTSVVIGTECIGSCKSNYHDHGHDTPHRIG